MRDIRNDLRERLAALVDEFEQASQAYHRERDERTLAFGRVQAELNRKIEAVQLLLDIESERSFAEGETATPEPRKPMLPLAQFLLTKLHADGAMSKDDLRAVAELAGYFNDGTVAAGRVIHSTMKNLDVAGKVERLPDGRFAIVTRRSAGQSELDMGGADMALN